MLRYNFTTDRIVNLDEIRVNTALLKHRVLAERKQRQVGQIVSAERGELITFCEIVIATGIAPPVYVIPRDHFPNGTLEGSQSLANKSDWMTAALHIQVLKLIHGHTSLETANELDTTAIQLQNNII